MIATIINSLSILFGSLCGLFIKKGLKDNYKITILDGLALCILVIGISNSIKSENIILVIFSIVIGTIIGEIFAIEDKLDNLGNLLQDKLSSKDNNISKAFVTSSLIYCIGAMAIVGSLEAGINKNYETLFAKSILDGISAIIFSSTLGIGVAFSSIPVFIYQGLITILASSIKEFLTSEVITEISAIGGIMIIAIAINIFKFKKIHIGNMLPAIFIPIIYYSIFNIVK